ncbi:hypothetical protein EVAR_32744_1 [Eumeta japonica]|uniref:Uncharacterized protein n=1 Tax=Eumeta variegata TaxID=151549 RepID=A0A4C1XL09_EUMVA|nr:hypothetical protein EVAR_32744_1 [Eumeta japonica]
MIRERSVITNHLETRTAPPPRDSRDSLNFFPFPSFGTPAPITVVSEQGEGSSPLSDDGCRVVSAGAFEWLKRGDRGRNATPAV